MVLAVRFLVVMLSALMFAVVKALEAKKEGLPKVSATLTPPIEDWKESCATSSPPLR